MPSPCPAAESAEFQDLLGGTKLTYPESITSSPQARSAGGDRSPRGQSEASGCMGCLAPWEVGRRWACCCDGVGRGDKRPTSGASKVSKGPCWGGIALGGL